jgi:hypothetical protein
MSKHIIAKASTLRIMLHKSRKLFLVGFVKCSPYQNMFRPEVFELEEYYILRKYTHVLCYEF